MSLKNKQKGEKEMNNTEKKTVNWVKILRPIALSLVLVFLLSYATYAWMKRDWTPSIHQENVKIVAGSSLTFIFQDKEIDDIPVNTLLNMPEFTFKSVSNATGNSNTFFNLNYGTQGEIFDTFNYLDEIDIISEYDVYDNKYTALGRSAGYIELRFLIASGTEGEAYDKRIYLDKDSHINGTTDANAAQTELNQQAAEAIRISITVHENDEEAEKTFIYAKSTNIQRGITDKYIEGEGYAADGAPRYNRDTGKEETTITNKYLAEPIPLIKESPAKTFDEFEAEELFILKKGEQRAVTVRIWLEGVDPNCKDAIAGSALDLLLQFTAKDVK